MENEKRLKELYLASFTEDSPEDAAFLFENVFSKAELIAKEEKGKVVSMLFLMDCCLKTNSGNLPYYYLYAACTDPEYRGKGLMGELLQEAKDFAKNKGKKGIILKPAKPSLFTFYERYGFSPFFKVSKAILNSGALASFKNTETKDISLERWWELRQNILSNLSDCFVSFDKELFLSAASDCKVATDGNGSFVVYEIREDTLLCKECIFENSKENGVFEIVATLLRKNNIEKAELRFPANKNPAIMKYTEEKYFSVISDVDRLCAQNPYHGFAFD